MAKKGKKKSSSKNQYSNQYGRKEKVNSQEGQEPTGASQSPSKVTAAAPAVSSKVKHPDQGRMSLEQLRASDALKKIKGLAESSDKGYYVSYVAALPAAIVSNGLGQALAMLLAKDKGQQKSEHYLLYQHLTTWLSGQIKELASGADNDIISKLMQNDQRVYIRAQTEAMAYLHWLKMFARAYLKDSGKQEQEHG